MKSGFELATLESQVEHSTTEPKPLFNTIPFTDMYEHFKRNAFVNTQNSIKEIGQSKGKLYCELYCKQCKS